MKVERILWFLIVLCLISSIESLLFGESKKASKGSGSLLQNVVTSIAGTPSREGEGAPYEAFKRPVISSAESRNYQAPQPRIKLLIRWF